MAAKPRAALDAVQTVKLPTTITATPSAGKRQLAQARLDQLFSAATAGRFWGVVAVEIAFENGQPTLVRHRLDGTDKN